MKSMPKTKRGITLIALIITIIVLLILAGITLNTLIGEGNIINVAGQAVEQSNIATKKTEIELEIVSEMLKEQGSITIEDIIEGLENAGIINQGDGNPDNGQVKTQPDGYIYEITEDEKGNWEVVYIGKGEIEKVEVTIKVEVSTGTITNKVIMTVIGKSEEGIKSFTSSKGDNKTYAAGTKEIKEEIEITTNGTYTFTVENNNGKTASKKITINNILEGIIQISADKTTPTKDNVKVTVVWPQGSESGIKEIKIGNGEWQTVTGDTSEVEVTTNCTVQARVRNSTEEVTTASLIISNIDKTIPTVTATAGTETITEGDSKEISSYFTYTANGTAEITSVVYTDTSNGNEVVTNTNTLVEGTHVIKCTVTKETGATASATKTIIVEAVKADIIDKTEIANNPSEYYGGEVTNYTTPSGDPNVKWRIFYADESNIYLIASDYVHYDYCPTGAKGSTLYQNSDYRLSFDNVYNDYTGSASITDTRITKWLQKYLAVAPTSTNTNIRAVAFMLDETRWSAMYANPSYAEYAIGGPTLEMFVASYNKAHPEKPMYCSANSTGYYISWSNGGTDTYISGLDTSESLYVISDTSKAYAMWLGSPSAYYYYTYVVRVDYDGRVGNCYYNYCNPGFRPLVCLKSDIQLEKQSDGTYLIK